MPYPAEPTPPAGAPRGGDPQDASNRLHFEHQSLAQGHAAIAGVDEAGRGPLAGPVVAAGVILPPTWLRHGLPPEFQGLNDSKQLTERNRNRFFEGLTAAPGLQHAVAIIDAPRIDALNILQATHQAMLEALQQLAPPPEHVLVDGRPVPILPWSQTAIVRGDARSYSIAAASILAKVTRDRLMADYDRTYPGYGFAQHKGYGTRSHLQALAKLGPCPIHRRSFAPLKTTQGELFD